MTVNKTRDELINALESRMKTGAMNIEKPEEISKEFFSEEKKEVDTEGKKEYAEIIGEAHPSGNKYWFTVYKPEDFDPEVRDLIPEIKEEIVFDHDYALSLLMSIEFDKTMFAFGPPGCGKTLTPEQVCARINYPYYFVAGMGGTEPSDYVGSPWVKDGSMDWKDGPISFMVRHGGYLAYDEPFKSSAQTNMCVQSLLDFRKTLKLYGHPDPVKGTLKAHKRFRIGLMDNVRGFGDEADRYAAEVQDQSTLNRCAYKLEVDYPTKDVEMSILQKQFPHAEKKLIRSIVAMAGNIRKAWSDRKLDSPFSLRDSSEWVECALFHNDVAEGFKQTYYNAINEDDQKKTVQDAWKIVFKSTVTL